MLQTQHASDLRELTERYETKVSNQNIENLELRQEIEVLRESLEALQAAPPKPDHAPNGPAVSEDDVEPVVAVAHEDSTPTVVSGLEQDEDFVSPWMVPDVDDVPEPPAAFDDDEAFGDEAAEDERDEEDILAPSPLGLSTGLAPNARLVEGLQASAFRSTEDTKKRRRRKR